MDCRVHTVAPRAGTSTVTYTRHLEEKVSELQTLLRRQPSTGNEIDDIAAEISREHATVDLIDTLAGPEDDYVFTHPAVGSSFYHGTSAGLSILRTIRKLCAKLAGVPELSSGVSADALAEAFDSNVPEFYAHSAMASLALLPSREKLQSAIAIAMDCVLNGQECIGHEELNLQIRNLYDKIPEDYTDEDHRSLALIYALLALGRRHETTHVEEDSERAEQDKVILKGTTYFRASRHLLNTTAGQDLNSVRTTIVLAHYLLASPMISAAYTYICTGVAISLRLGLHVSSASLRARYSPKELFERRRVFSVLYMTDTYLASILGMPKIVRDIDTDQILPAPEEEIHDYGQSLVKRDPLSRTAEAILNARLFQIEARITENRFFPEKTTLGEHGKYEERYQEIADREAELQEWHKQLPAMPPQTAVDPRVLRSQLLLRLYYASVRVCLYRPFLHHVVRSKHAPDFSYRGYACGSACLESAMQAVWLVDAFARHGFLHEAQWHNIYLLALAATALMLFVLGAADGPTVAESRAAALRAQELLRDLGRHNAAARRCYDSLAALPHALQKQQGQQDDQQALPGAAAIVAAAAASGVSPRSQFMMGIGVAAQPSDWAADSD